MRKWRMNRNTTTSKHLMEEKKMMATITFVRRHVGKSLPVCIAVLCLSLHASSPAGAVTLSNDPMYGVSLEQLNFEFEGGFSEYDSRWGQIRVDPSALEFMTTMSAGYINVYAPLAGGWVVQNFFVDANDGYGMTSTYFDLASAAPSALGGFDARIEFTAGTKNTFAAGGEVNHDVNPDFYNAEGGGDGPVTYIGSPFGAGGPVAGPTTVDVSQPNAVNVETAKNQCAPMAVANSLQYLENRYPTRITVPNDHKTGLKGDDSLVGQLDTKMNRNVVDRANGGAMWMVPWVKGKFEYLKEKGLQNKLTHKYQGRGWGTGAGKQLPGGDFTWQGITAKDKGAKPTWEWIRDELKAGEDVELWFSYDNASGAARGGHVVRAFEAGETEGKKWIRYLHDSKQTEYKDPSDHSKGFINDDQGLENVKVELKDTDGDGFLNFGSPNRELRFAFSESVIPEPGGLSVLALGMLNLGGLAMIRRRRK